MFFWCMGACGLGGGPGIYVVEMVVLSLDLCLPDQGGTSSGYHPRRVGAGQEGTGVFPECRLTTVPASSLRGGVLRRPVARRGLSARAR